MKIYSVNDPEFSEYGKVLDGYDTAELISAMDSIALPADGVAYEPWIDSLEKCGIFKALSDNGFGGMPIQLGMCWGHNKALNCLEYHRNSEINIGSADFILLLAKQEKIIGGVLDSADVKAFRAPAGAVVEVYALKSTISNINTQHIGRYYAYNFKIGELIFGFLPDVVVFPVNGDF